MINYYKVSVKGRNIKRFLNKLFNLGINIIDISYKKDEVVFKVSYEDYLIIKDIKTIYEVNIIGISGVKQAKVLFTKYKIFIIFFIFSIILVFFMSKIILSIDIQHESKQIKDLMSEELKKQGLTLFSFGKDYDELQIIKEQIKKEHKDKIEWIEIERIGVTYVVKVIERKNTKSINDERFVNIVAKSSGLIMDMYVKSGEIIKNKGDYVQKGDVIVSGIIKRNDNIVDLVTSSADVYAEVWYKVKVSSSFSYEEKIKSDKGKRSLIISIFNKDFKLFSINKKNNSDDEKSLFKSSIVNVNLKDEVEIISNIKKYTEKELLEKLQVEALNKIKNDLTEKEEVLLQKTLKKQVNNGKMYIEVFFKVYKNISDIKEIQLQELEQKEN